MRRLPTALAVLAAFTVSSECFAGGNITIYPPNASGTSVTITGIWSTDQPFTGSLTLTYTAGTAIAARHTFTNSGHTEGGFTFTVTGLTPGVEYSGWTVELPLPGGGTVIKEVPPFTP